MTVSIKQQHARGCGPAVLAMVCNQTYEDVVQSFGEHDFEKKGLYWPDLVHYLEAAGFALRMKSKVEGWSNRTERECWPLPPFAPIHIAEVKVAESSPVIHWVVMLHEGTVLDPLSSEPRMLADFHEVYHIAGLYYVEGHPGLKKPDVPTRRDSHGVYEQLIGPLREKAKELGYALGAHGSLVRDIDLIACPWTSQAVDAVTLAKALMKVAAAHGPCGIAFFGAHETGAYFRAGCPGGKAHQRLCWTFHLGGGPYIDLSVMPRLPHLPTDEIARMREVMESDADWVFQKKSP